ncbi:MAG: PH domain-containing protein [Cellvibrionales bacterium]|nr:PH domain-containing protein [Cellvibrionales bacterium]
MSDANNAVYSVSPTMFRSNPVGFIVCLFLILVFGIGALILIGWYLITKYTKLKIDRDEIVFSEGVLSRRHSHIPLDRVSTVKVYQSIMDRIFNIGKIEIYGAGDVLEVAVKGIPNPDELRRVIKSRQRK